MLWFPYSQTSDIDGLGVMKLTFGIKVHGIRIRIRRESKVLSLAPCAFVIIYATR